MKFDGIGCISFEIEMLKKKAKNKMFNLPSQLLQKSLC